MDLTYSSWNVRAGDPLDCLDLRWVGPALEDDWEDGLEASPRPRRRTLPSEWQLERDPETVPDPPLSVEPSPLTKASKDARAKERWEAAQRKKQADRERERAIARYKAKAAHRRQIEQRDRWDRSAAEVEAARQRALREEVARAERAAYREAAAMVRRAREEAARQQAARERLQRHTGRPLGVHVVLPTTTYLAERGLCDICSWPQRVINGLIAPHDRCPGSGQAPAGRRIQRG